MCSLHYAYATPDALCLVLEWLRGGSLQYHLKRRRAQVERRERIVPFDEPEVRCIPYPHPNPNPNPNPSPSPNSNPNPNPSPSPIPNPNPNPNRSPNPNEVRFYAGCIVLGLEAMHAVGIVY